jgi:hypothetical protein
VFYELRGRMNRFCVDAIVMNAFPFYELGWVLIRKRDFGKDTNEVVEGRLVLSVLAARQKSAGDPRAAAVWRAVSTDLSPFPKSLSL